MGGQTSKQEIQPEKLKVNLTNTNFQHEYHLYNPFNDQDSQPCYGSEECSSSTTGESSSKLELKDTFVHRYSRRHQPYQIPKKQQKKIETPSPSTSSLFGPSLSPSTTIVSDDSTSSLILNDSEILDDFDQFVRSPSTHFLLSPPLSPILLPDDDDQLDFNDFSLFP
ncbi:hypothetical protein G6F56_006573 [Rhizopus delemar]|nr:hypothetical protein G6F56_006573 [Rhizopus delemar]